MREDEKGKMTTMTTVGGGNEVEAHGEIDATVKQMDDTKIEVEESAAVVEIAIGTTDVMTVVVIDTGKTIEARNAGGGVDKILLFSSPWALHNGQSGHGVLEIPFQWSQANVRGIEEMVQICISINWDENLYNASHAGEFYPCIAVVTCYTKLHI